MEAVLAAEHNKVDYMNRSGCNKQQTGLGLADHYGLSAAKTSSMEWVAALLKPQDLAKLDCQVERKELKFEKQKKDSKI